MDFQNLPLGWETRAWKRLIRDHLKELIERNGVREGDVPTEGFDRCVAIWLCDRYYEHIGSDIYRSPNPPMTFEIRTSSGDMRWATLTTTSTGRPFSLVCRLDFIDNAIVVDDFPLSCCYHLATKRLMDMYIPVMRSSGSCGIYLSGTDDSVAKWLYSWYVQNGPEPYGTPFIFHGFFGWEYSGFTMALQPSDGEICLELNVTSE